MMVRDAVVRRQNRSLSVSIYDVAENFFDACRLSGPSDYSNGTACEDEFEFHQDHRDHFKSDVHCLTVKLNTTGRDIAKKQHISVLTSEDEADGESFPSYTVNQKLLVRLQTGELVSLWKCLVLNESERVLLHESNDATSVRSSKSLSFLRVNEVIDRLKLLIHEPRDQTHLRAVFLASGGRFAGCVFDGDSVVVHKTLHRYVVRAKAGKKQSSRDSSGRVPHSAGASLRRYNELALKKDIQELLASWKAYLKACSHVFICAPSRKRGLFFNKIEKYVKQAHCVVQNIPLTVGRPTFKEAQHVYKQLTQIMFVAHDKVIQLDAKGDSMANRGLQKPIGMEETKASGSDRGDDELPAIAERKTNVICTTLLHQAAQVDDADRVMELLQQGLNPCAMDERRRTPYMLANEKETRNVFRRFMALNLDRWDWNAAKVPSALTQEMEGSQTAKLAKKGSRRREKQKELKKLLKSKEKKGQVQWVQAEAAATAASCTSTVPVGAAASDNKSCQSKLSKELQVSEEEATKREQAVAREKRAAAAEKRIAAAAAAATTTSTPTAAG